MGTDIRIVSEGGDSVNVVMNKCFGSTYTWFLALFLRCSMLLGFERHYRSLSTNNDATAQCQTYWDLNSGFRNTRSGCRDCGLWIKSGSRDILTVVFVFCKKERKN